MNYPMQYIPISELVLSRTPLRSVLKNTVEFVELVSSIRVDGVLQPIIVRKDDVRGEGYEVVEGNNRLEASKEAALNEMPCVIRELTDKEVLLLQLKCNAVRPRPTASYDFARRLRKLIEGGETLGSISASIDKSPAWVRRILALNNLIPDASERVSNGTIKMSKAISLAGLPHHLQGLFIDEACTLTTKDFCARVQEAKRDYDAFLLKSKLDSVEDGILPHLRTLRDLMLESDTHEMEELVLTACEASTPADGWKAALAWATKLDPVTVRRRKEGKKDAKLGRLTNYQWRVKQRELIENLTFNHIKYGAPNE